MSQFLFEKRKQIRFLGGVLFYRIAEFLPLCSHVRLSPIVQLVHVKWRFAGIIVPPRLHNVLQQLSCSPGGIEGILKDIVVALDQEYNQLAAWVIARNVKIHQVFEEVVEIINRDYLDSLVPTVVAAPFRAAIFVNITPQPFV